MIKLSHFFVAVFVLVALAATSHSLLAQEPIWYPYVIARGQDRAVIENTPMELRPYRPFHFYGNTVRRLHYRGNPFLAPRDLVRGSSVWLQRSNPVPPLGW